MKNTTYHEDNDLSKPLVQVPTIRACPKCFCVCWFIYFLLESHQNTIFIQFIKHSDKCKHMKCPECDAEFCFACLQTKKPDGKWPCGQYYNQCPVKGRQQLR